MFMSMESTKNGFSENQVVEGFLNGGLLEYDAGVVQTLESNDEIIRYAMLAPSSPEAQQLAFIMYKITKGQDISDEESDYLDSIDSRFIGHSNPSEFSKREVLCWFLNQYWDWSKPEWGNYRNVSVSVKGLFEAYTQFCKDHSVNKNTRRLTRNELSKYLFHYGKIKRSRENVDGKKLNNYIIANLPEYKDSLTEIPEFDLRNMVK